jgi:hypothetical protein
LLISGIRHFEIRILHSPFPIPDWPKAGFEKRMTKGYVDPRVNDLGKILVIAGLVMAAAGALLWSGVGRGWLGRLPGDLHYSRGNFSFYFPVVTCLLLSLLLTILLRLFRR